MNRSTETIATLDTNLAPLGCRFRQRACRMRRLKAQRSMRAVAIVVVDEEREDVLEVLLVQDQQPVETFRASGADEPPRHPFNPTPNFFHELLGLDAIVPTSLKRIRVFGPECIRIPTSRPWKSPCLGERFLSGGCSHGSGRV